MQVKAEKKTVLRQCAVTRMVLDRTALVRFVVSPEGQLVPDLKMKLPGRGVWIKAERSVIEKALKTGVFGRALKQKVRGQENLPGHVAELLHNQLVSGLSIANKAGSVTTGFERLLAKLTSGKITALYHTQDAGIDGCEKLDRKFAKNKNISPGALENRLPMTSEVASHALGLSNVRHIGLAKSDVSDRFVAALQKYLHYINS